MAIDISSVVKRNFGGWKGWSGSNRIVTFLSCVPRANGGGATADGGRHGAATTEAPHWRTSVPFGTTGSGRPERERFSQRESGG